MEADYAVNAGGLWAREVGRMAGVELPIVPMEHQYIVTNDIPAVAALEREVAMCIDFDGESYLRQEGKGSAGALLKDKQLYDNLNSAASELRGLVADIRKDPQKYLRVKVSLF